MKNNTLQISIALAFVVLLGLLTDPFMLFMPPMALTGALLVAVLLLGVWSGFVMREKAVDERELVHRMNAGRIAYLASLAVLTAALLVQGLAHDIDPWVAGVLAVMVVAKLSARLYFDQYR